MNKRKVDVVCSPGTYKRVTIDPHYRETVAANSVPDLENYDEIVFSEYTQASTDVDSITESVNVDDPYDSSTWLQDQKKFVWLDSSTKMLIAKVKEYRPLVGKVGSLKNKSQMWNKISQDLTACGHEVNTSQVQAKYFSLERQYKKVQLHNSKTGRNRLTCPYQR
ncbi:uncharacterized protein [Musca autumnalis]|uniref:uncharacterized protein n=1 Tax=Musca autumnalis TaxID=221902 RepID=UPI003CF59A0F